jgi:hypothetical protein
MLATVLVIARRLDPMARTLGVSSVSTNSKRFESKSHTAIHILILYSRSNNLFSPSLRIRGKRLRI